MLAVREEDKCVQIAYHDAAGSAVAEELASILPAGRDRWYASRTVQNVKDRLSETLPAVSRNRGRSSYVVLTPFALSNHITR